jgi:flagellar hook assembly protein FlgD
MFTDFEEYLSVEENDNLPRQTSLAQNYPNPFNPSTSVLFYLAKAGNIEFSIYDLLGQKVYHISKTGVIAGEHSLVWDGVDMNGSPVASGIYFYRLSAGDFVDTKQMILLK